MDEWKCKVRKVCEKYPSVFGYLEVWDEILNHSLRKGLLTKAIHQLYCDINQSLSEVDHLPTKVALFRGIRDCPEISYASLNVGQEMVSPGFSSFTGSLSTAKYFAYGTDDTDLPGFVMYIMNYEGPALYFDSLKEDEFLLPTGCKFVVTRKEDHGPGKSHVFVDFLGVEEPSFTLSNQDLQDFLEHIEKLRQSSEIIIYEAWELFCIVNRVTNPCGDLDILETCKHKLLRDFLKGYDNFTRFPIPVKEVDELFLCRESVKLLEEGDEYSEITTVTSLVEFLERLISGYVRAYHDGSDWKIIPRSE